LGDKIKKIKIYFAECLEKTLGKESFAECQIVGTRQRRLFAECQPSALGKDFAERHICRVFHTRQTCLCRVGSCAECPALGKEARCREPIFTKCGSRQILLCRVPDKRHSAKRPTLGKASDSGSVTYKVSEEVYKT
jgi:hypothetical protein